MKWYVIIFIFGISLLYCIETESLVLVQMYEGSPASRNICEVTLTEENIDIKNCIKSSINIDFKKFSEGQIFPNWETEIENEKLIFQKLIKNKNWLQLLEKQRERAINEIKWLESRFKKSSKICGGEHRYLNAKLDISSNQEVDHLYIRTVENPEIDEDVILCFSAEPKDKILKTGRNIAYAGAPIGRFILFSKISLIHNLKNRFQLQIFSIDLKTGLEKELYKGPGHTIDAERYLLKGLNNHQSLFFASGSLFLFDHQNGRFEKLVTVNSVFLPFRILFSSNSQKKIILIAEKVDIEITNTVWILLDLNQDPKFIHLTKTIDRWPSNIIQSEERIEIDF